MDRLNVFEIEDFAWYPAVLRKSQTDFLRFLMETFDVFGSIMPILDEVLSKTRHFEITDLCSGAGGSVMMLRKHWQKKQQPIPKIMLSDLYPNLEAYRFLEKKTNGQVSFFEKPILATDCPKSEGMVTVFNAFHHLSPQEAEILLKKIVANRQNIGIFEPIDKSLWQIVANILVLSILPFLVMPFLKPFRWSRLFFTYLLPLVPFCTLWDGIASVFRLYSQKQLHELVKKADPEGLYFWQIGKAKHPFGKVIYLCGYPKKMD